MKVKQIVPEDFVNYKKPSMFIGTSYCTGKCYKELGMSCEICQNSSMMNANSISIDDKLIVEKYKNNPITQAIVFGGLEPFDQFDELYEFIYFLRNHENCNDDVIVYTGYNKDEINKQVDMLSKFNNIIVKFGRYIPNEKSHYDEVLGVELASNNQYAERL